MSRSLLGGLSPDQFLQQFWQTKPLFVEQAFTGLSELVDGNDLAGIACEPDAEARLISGSDSSNHWQSRSGPFDDQDFANLPEQNWSLLVQAIDQWLPDAAKILDTFDFLPRWRLDDLMASYSPLGGGVGPHFDYYDVFLIQLSGERQWRLGQHCDEQSALRDDSDMKLLVDFTQTASHHCRAGDMLYIPAGTAHWGTAITDNCITLSVGFRAPSYKELLSEAVDMLLDELPENLRYKDPSLQSTDSSYAVSQHHVGALSSVADLMSSERLTYAVQEAFMRQMTAPKYPELVQPLVEEEQITATEFSEWLDIVGECVLRKNPSSRFAYDKSIADLNTEQVVLYVDAQGLLCSRDVAEKICCEQPLTANCLGETERYLLSECINNGSLLLPTVD